MILRTNLKWGALTTALKENRINIVDGKNLADGIKIQAVSVDDFKRLTYLDSHMLPYHTYALTKDKPQKVVIHGIPDTVEEVEIAEELASKYDIISVLHRMKNGPNRAPISLVLVTAKIFDERC